MRIQDTVAYRYAKWGMPKRNKKVPKYVKLQEKEWIKICDGKSKKAYIDEGEVQQIADILDLMVHPDLNCPMTEGLEPYAWLFIIAVLCTKTVDEDGIEVLYYQTAILEIARKNFKTFTSAVIFIILMLTGKHFGRYFSVAPDKDIASELKIAVKKIIKVSPELYNEYDPMFELLRSEIRCLATDSVFTPLAYGKDRMDSRTANAFLADETGAMDGYPVEAMRSSQITLHDKLGIIISTQYPKDDNGFDDEVDTAKRTLDGLRDRRIFALLYEPNDDLKNDDAWQTDDNVLYQANPVAIEHKYILDDLKEKREDATLYENKRENFLCKHCNIKYRSLGTEGYIDIQKFRMCAKKIPDSWWAGRKVYIGLDLSQTEDNTAVAMITEEADIIYAKVFGFIPKEAIIRKSKKEDIDYKRLIRQGDCFACGEEVIDYKFVEDLIIGLPEKYGVEIVQCGYDPYNALSTVQKLEANAIECVMIRQHSSILHSPTKLLKEKSLSKSLVYDENDLLENNMQNARCTEDTNKNKYVNKKKSSGKVDMVVAIINSMYLEEQSQLHGDVTVQII